MGIRTDSAVSEDSLDDELKMSMRAFDDLEGYFTTVGEQANALAQQGFEADVLNEEVPGDIGESLD